MESWVFATSTGRSPSSAAVLVSPRLARTSRLAQFQLFCISGQLPFSVPCPLPVLCGLCRSLDGLPATEPWFLEKIKMRAGDAWRLWAEGDRVRRRAKI